PDDDAPVMKYLKEHRAALGGPVPSRSTEHKPLQLPGDKAYEVVKRGSGKQEIASTMALVRLLKDLMRDKETGKRWVPIVPDEARTFGMDSLSPTAKIYNPDGQNYLSVDPDRWLATKAPTSGKTSPMADTDLTSLPPF